jgi:hypothetical protein
MFFFPLAYAGPKPLVDAGSKIIVGHNPEPDKFHCTRWTNWIIDKRTRVFCGSCNCFNEGSLCMACCNFSEGQNTYLTDSCLNILIRGEQATLGGSCCNLFLGSNNFGICSCGNYVAGDNAKVYNACLSFGSGFEVITQGGCLNGAYGTEAEAGPGFLNCACNSNAKARGCCTYASGKDSEALGCCTCSCGEQAKLRMFCCSMGLSGPSSSKCNFCRCFSLSTSERKAPCCFPNAKEREIICKTLKKPKLAEPVRQVMEEEKKYAE